MCHSVSVCLSVSVSVYFPSQCCVRVCVNMCLCLLISAIFHFQDSKFSVAIFFYTTPVDERSTKANILSSRGTSGKAKKRIHFNIARRLLNSHLTAFSLQQSKHGNKQKHGLPDGGNKHIQTLRTSAPDGQGGSTAQIITVPVPVTSVLDSDRSNRIQIANRNCRFWISFSVNSLLISRLHMQTFAQGRTITHVIVGVNTKCAIIS